MTGVYADTSAIVDGQQIDASDVKTPIDALDTALNNLATGAATFTAIVTNDFTMETEDASRMLFDQYGSPTTFSMRRAGGTKVSPSNITSGQTLGTFAFGGRQNGSMTSEAASMQGVATENWSGASTRGARLEFKTTPTGTASNAIALTIHSDRSLEIKDSAATPGTPTAAVMVWSASGELKVLGDDGVTSTIGNGMSTSALTTTAAVNIGGDLNHDGSNVGFFATAPAARSTGWTTFTNLASDKTCDANATSVAELADILGTLIEYLKLIGLLAA